MAKGDPLAAPLAETVPEEPVVGVESLGPGDHEMRS